MKPCPYCAEPIQDAAVFCRFCRRSIEPASAGVPPPLAPRAPVLPVAPNSYAEAALRQTEGALRGSANLLPKASLGGRVVAKVIDYFIGLGPAALAWGWFKATILNSAGQAIDGKTEALVIPVVLLVVSVWGVWYMLTKDGNARGAGYGKRAMGLMVVHVDSRKPCGKGQSAIRQIVLHFTYLVPVLGWLTEPVAVFLTAGGRRVGDLLAGTQVVNAADWRAVPEPGAAGFTQG